MRASLLVLSTCLAACGGGGASGGSAAPSTTSAPAAAPASGGGTASSLSRGDVIATAAGASELAYVAEEGATYLAILTSGAGGEGDHPYRLSITDGLSDAAVEVEDCALGPVEAEPAPALTIEADRAPAVGEKRTFQFRGAESTPVTAKAVAVGRYAVVWADVGPEHPAAIDQTFADAFLADFERLILPRARLIFGAESDVDGDGRIALLFTPLTRTKAVAFFSGCDLHASCSGSNGGEVLYLTPPNAIRPPYNTPRAIKEILAHELEHLLHHHHKVLAHDLDDDPDGLYLHEGFGALAQDVTGFQAGNLYVTKAGLAQLDETSLNPLLAEGSGYDGDRDGPQRGIAYLFTRWIYDRAGGDEVDGLGAIADLGGPTLLRSLLAAETSVAAAILTRSDRARLIADFYTAVAAPRGGGDNPCFGFRDIQTDPLTGKQRGADPYATFHGQAMGGAARQDFPGDGTIRPGGAELVRLPPATGAKRIAIEAPAEGRVALRLMRVE